jgi:hypothetical protein
MVWLRDVLINGTLIGVTDGSFNRHNAKSCSGLGWILVCTASKRTLRGRSMRYLWQLGCIVANYWG